VLPCSNSKQHYFSEIKTKEADKTPDSSSRHTTVKEPTIPGKTLQETLAMFEYFKKHGHVFPQMTSNTENPLKDVTTQGASTALASPIPSLNPLASSFEIHGTEVINVEYMTPIEPKELSSSEFFFSKKRKAIVQREILKKGGVITKRQRIIFDGEGQSEPEFAKWVVDSLGSFATTNLWSMENLREKIDQKYI
jgi:hypothetical protein